MLKAIVLGLLSAMAAAPVLGEHATVWNVFALLFALGLLSGFVRRAA